MAGLVGGEKGKLEMEGERVGKERKYGGKGGREA